MANAQYGNKIVVDAEGSVTTSTIKISHMIFTPSADDDSVTLRESSDGPDIIKIQRATKDTLHIRCEDVPILFNGLYVQALSSGATLMIVTTSRGAG